MEGSDTHLSLLVRLLAILHPIKCLPHPAKSPTHQARKMPKTWASHMQFPQPQWKPKQWGSRHTRTTSGKGGRELECQSPRPGCFREVGLYSAYDFSCWLEKQDDPSWMHLFPRCDLVIDWSQTVTFSCLSAFQGLGWVGKGEIFININIIYILYIYIKF